MVARCERGKPHHPERPRVIALFDADAFGTNAATVSYLPPALRSRRGRRKRDVILMSFL
jgi:hypothetical protein